MGRGTKTHKRLPSRCRGDWSRSQTSSHSLRTERQVQRSNHNAGGGGIQKYRCDRLWLQVDQRLGHQTKSEHGLWKTLIGMTLKCRRPKKSPKQVQILFNDLFLHKYTITSTNLLSIYIFIESYFIFGRTSLN